MSKQHDSKFEIGQSIKLIGRKVGPYDPQATVTAIEREYILASSPNCGAFRIYRFGEEKWQRAN